jgi:tRNA G18 (ribose-2'-O)-methylase SpoU
MEEKQLHHHQIKFKTLSTIEIDVLVDEMYSPANLGSIFRNAEAFGVKTIWVHENNKPELKSNRFKRTARSTDKNITIHFYNDFDAVLKTDDQLKIGVEITTTSQPIQKIKILKIRKVLLIVGNEKHGIKKELIEKLDHIFHIDMYGQNSSLNVSQSLGIALYEIRR